MHFFLQPSFLISGFSGFSSQQPRPRSPCGFPVLPAVLAPSHLASSPSRHHATCRPTSSPLPLDTPLDTPLSHAALSDCRAYDCVALRHACGLFSSRARVLSCPRAPSSPAHNLRLLLSPIPL